MNFNKVKNIYLPEGEVVKITNNNNQVLWEKTYVYTLISNGTQVIDTGVYCTDKMSCEIKMAWTAFPSTASATYIGAIEYKNGNYLRCHFQVGTQSSNRVLGFWQDSPQIGNVVSVPYDNEPHILTYSAVDMTAGIDGTIATHGNTPTPSNSTFYLFDRNVVGFTANAEAGKCKVYYAKFWEDGQLIRDFIPRIGPNNKLGLFDLVEEKYYYDMNGNDFAYEEFQVT